MAKKNNLNFVWKSIISKKKLISDILCDKTVFVDKTVPVSTIIDNIVDNLNYHILYYLQEHFITTMIIRLSLFYFYEWQRSVSARLR